MKDHWAWICSFLATLGVIGLVFLMSLTPFAAWICSGLSTIGLLVIGTWTGHQLLTKDFR